MTLMPDDPNDILAALDAELDDCDMPEEAVDITKLSNLALSTLFNETRDELMEMGAMMERNPNTEKARELHSIRSACLVEMSKRGMS